MDTTLDLGTDVAAFLIYHPDDLEHRADAPLGWYGYDFAYLAEAQAGRLVAIGTGADGGYRIRLTTGALTPDEAAAERARVSSPYVVRHGRMFVDNTDGLPGEDRMLDPDERPTQWVELANGPYRVTVVEIDWSGDASLPSYVVQFEAVESLAQVELPVRFPGRSEFWHTAPEPSPRRAREQTPLDATYPLFAVGAAALVPGQTGTVPTERDLAETMFRLRQLVTVPDETATLGTLTRVRGSSWSPSTGSMLRLEGLRLVEVQVVEPGHPLPTTRVAPVARDERVPTDLETEALFEAIAAFADRDPRWADQPSPLWTRDRIAARDLGWQDALALAADALGLAYADRLALAQQSDADQAAGLTQRLQRSAASSS